MLIQLFLLLKLSVSQSTLATQAPRPSVVIVNPSPRPVSSIVIVAPQPLPQPPPTIDPSPSSPGQPNGYVIVFTDRDILPKSNSFGSPSESPVTLLINEGGTTANNTGVL
jgi:hypothetical protein